MAKIKLGVLEWKPSSCFNFVGALLYKKSVNLIMELYLYLHKELCYTGSFIQLCSNMGFKHLVIPLNLSTSRYAHGVVFICMSMYQFYLLPDTEYPRKNYLTYGSVLSKISVPHSGDYEDYCLLGFQAVYYDRCVPTFRRNLPSSE